MRRRHWLSAAVAAGIVLGPAALPALAQQSASVPKINAGDTAWMLVATALVMLMTPGLAFFYAGMVRRKNVMGTLMHSFIMLGLIGVQWVLWGYSLAFGPDHGGIIGGLAWVALRGVGLAPNPQYAATIPHQLFMMYQGMFAIITPALITGAFAERIRFGPFVLFSVLWATLIYDPLAHWVWGVGGWLRALGALDFAGGTVVHINAGVAGLVTAMLIGPRKGFKHEPMPPHSLPLTLLGASILWFGWFGFNAGSSLGSGALATAAFVNTNTATAAAMIGWLLVDWIGRGKATALGAVSGAVAGLVAITPAAGFVNVRSAMVIGLLAGVICGVAVILRARTRLDDALDVFSVHGLGGTWGALATGLLAEKAVNAAGANGLFFGNAGQLWTQFLAVLVTYVYAGVGTYILYKIVHALFGLRTTSEEELMGLDLSQHEESGYNF